MANFGQNKNGRYTKSSVKSFLNNDGSYQNFDNSEFVNRKRELINNGFSRKGARRTALESFVNDVNYTNNSGENSTIRSNYRGAFRQPLQNQTVQIGNKQIPTSHIITNVSKAKDLTNSIDYNMIRTTVNSGEQQTNGLQTQTPSPTTHSIPQVTTDELARRTIRGEFGNGQDRINKFKELGYDYNKIQNLINSYWDKENKTWKI